MNGSKVHLTGHEPNRMASYVTTDKLHINVKMLLANFTEASGWGNVKVKTAILLTADNYLF